MTSITPALKFPKAILFFIIIIVSSFQNAAAHVITTIAGQGSDGFSGDGGPATSASLSVPQGIIFDNSDNLIFADWNMLGQTVYSGKPVIHGGKLEEQLILPGNIASGTYQLNLHASGGYSRTFRIIVAR